MLRCMICDLCSGDDAVTCPACGEASWAAPSTSPEPAKRPVTPIAESPDSEVSPRSRRKP